MVTAEWAPYRLDFRFTARTSRESMTYKDTYLVRLRDTDTGREAVGECALFRGLSADDVPDYEQRLGRLLAPLRARRRVVDTLRSGERDAGPVPRGR